MTVTTAMPDDVVFGKVVGRFLLAVGDSFDDDRLPDATPASGTITFSPVVPNFKVNLPGPATVVKAPIRCSIDNTGRLLDTNQAVGVWLIAGHYRVTYALEGMTIDSHTIEVTTDHDDDTPLDLTNALPPSGPAITPTQYSELSGRLDAIDYPVDSVNGMLGDVVLDAADVNAYSRPETDNKFATQQQLVDAQFEQVNQDLSNITPTSLNVYTKPEVDAQFDAVDYPVDSVNGKVGDVILSAADVGALTKAQGDQYYTPAGALDTVGVYSGRWDSGRIYIPGDMVVLDEILWAATQQSQNVRPAIDVQINPAGGDGGPGNYTMNTLVGNQLEYAHPIRLTRNVLLGSIKFLVATGDLPAGTVGISTTRPTGSTSATLITPATSFATKSGSGWQEIVLDDPIQLQGETDYFVILTGGVGNLSGQLMNQLWAYTAPMKQPSNVEVSLRPSSNGSWGTSDRHAFVQLGEFVPPTWEALSDLSGDLVTQYAPLGASYTKAEADAKFALDNEMAWKTVVDPATDARPSALHVIWVGGAVKPANMTTEDLWVQDTA